MDISERLLKDLSDREFRHLYLRDMVTEWLAQQIKQLRKDRNWTQADLAEAAGDKAQSAIARLESVDYGNWSTKSLLELAAAFDVALQIRFVSWPEFESSVSDTSPKRMGVPGFSTAQFSLRKTSVQQHDTEDEPSTYSGWSNRLSHRSALPSMPANYNGSPSDDRQVGTVPRLHEMRFQ